MIRMRLALYLAIALGLAASGAACQRAPAESGAEVLQTVAELRAQVATLERKVARLEQELAAAKEPAVEPSGAPKAQCAGQTASGARCKRAAREGSSFCWQHKG